MQIMTPVYRTDKEVPVVVPKENWYASPADRFNEAEEEAEDRKGGDEGVPDLERLVLYYIYEQPNKRAKR